MEKTFDALLAPEFHVGGNSPFCRPPAAGHAVTYFSSQWESLAEKFACFTR